MEPRRPWTHHPTLRAAGAFAAVYVGYVATALLGLGVAPADLAISLLWLPTGVCTAALFRWGYWPQIGAVWLGAATMNYISFGMNPWEGSLVLAGQTLGPAASVALLRHLGFTPTFQTRRDVWVFSLAAVAGMLLPASCGVIGLGLVDQVTSETLVSAWLQWWLGDSLGVFVAAPLLMAIQRKHLQRLEGMAREFGVWLLLLGAAAMTFVTIGDGPLVLRLPTAFLTVPLVLWGAMRFGSLGGALAPLVLAIAAAYATSLARGPFIDPLNRSLEVPLLWSYLSMLTAVSLVTRALQAERLTTKAELMRSQALLAGICNVQNDFILGGEPGDIFSQILENARELTQSQHGFVGEVIYGENDEPTLRMFAMTQPHTSGALQVRGLDPEVESIRLHPLDSLLASAIAARQPMLRNGLSRQTGDALLPGLTNIENFLSLPILLRGRVIGLLGLANAPHGYSASHVELLDPVRATCGAILDGTANRNAREKAERLAKELAYFDPLTGLPNRRLLRKRLQDALTQVQENRNYGVCFFVDLDDFKVINDTLGHNTGDELLIHVARRMHDTVGRDCTVARIAGDEFVVLLPHVGDLRVAAERRSQDYARTLLNEIRAPYEIGGVVRHTSASIGGCIISPDLQTIDELLKNADAAMYAAKEAGRNTIRFFDPHLQLSVQRQGQLQLDLRDALENGNIAFHAQTLFGRKREPVSMELLARWNHPSLGAVSPADFVQIAEQSGLIHELGRRALEVAFDELQQNRNSSMSVAVNVSVLQLQHPDFVEYVRTRLQKTGVPPGRLSLELTESHLLESSAPVAEALEILYGLGVRLVLDDFGTGYSSFSYLKNLPLSAIKIDRAFVRGISDSSVDRIIAISMIRMAHELGLSVTAEGVETEEQFAILHGAGCDTFQGFLLSRPSSVFARAQEESPWVTPSPVLTDPARTDR